MYHAIVLEDLLDVLNLATGSTNVMSSAASARLTELVRAALALPGRHDVSRWAIPMFNDSVSWRCARAGGASRVCRRNRTLPRPPPQQHRLRSSIGRIRASMAIAAGRRCC